MVLIVFDTSVLIAYGLREPGFEEVKKWLNAVADGEAAGLISAVTVCELLEKFTRINGTEVAIKALDLLKRSGVVVMEVTERIARLAGPLKARYPQLSTADAIIMATAHVNKAALYTLDKGFWGVGGVELMGIGE